MQSLVLLRNDLRLDDNPAMKNAFIQSELIHVLYFYSKKQLKLHNESYITPSTGLFFSTRAIETDGFLDEPETLLKFFEDNNFDKLFFNNTFGIDENNRDSKIIKLFKAKNYEFERFDDRFLLNLDLFKQMKVNHTQYLRLLKESGLNFLI